MSKNLEQQTLIKLLQQQSWLEAIDLLEESEAGLLLQGNILHSPSPIATKVLQDLSITDTQELILSYRLKARSLDAHGESLLHQSVRHNHHSELQRWLHWGARVNGQNHFGQTPLHLAATLSDSSYLEHLLLAGADLDIQDIEGNTPALEAIRYNQLNNALLLSANGADLNIADQLGRTPIHLAIETENETLATLLAENQASLQGSNYTTQQHTVLKNLRSLFANLPQELQQHSYRVACMARFLADKLQLKKSHVQTIFLGGLFHDFGKVSLPDTIFDLSDEQLNDELLELLMTHPIDGYEALIHQTTSDPSWPYQNIILEHHEAWNGSGFPNGLSGTTISLGARIVALVDFLDHLTTERPHDPRVSYPEALSQIESLEDEYFQPELVALLLAYQEGLVPYLNL